MRREVGVGEDELSQGKRKGKIDGDGRKNMKHG